MSAGVVLARVSLNEKLLAVTDHRGVIVLVSEDASWALGLAGPASSFVGSSLLDHLTDEDKIEYKVRPCRMGVGSAEPCLDQISRMRRAAQRRSICQAPPSAAFKIRLAMSTTFRNMPSDP